MNARIRSSLPTIALFFIVLFVASTAPDTIENCALRVAEQWKLERNRVDDGGSELLLQFMVEAVTLSMLGGIICIVLSAAVSLVLADVMQLPFLFNPRINLLSFVFSAVIGVVFGCFPARRAAMLDPIDAIRHE